MIKRKQNKRAHAKTPFNVVFGVLLALLIIYTLFLIFSLGWSLLTSLKSPLDFEMNRNILGLPSTNADDPFNSVDALKFGNYSKIFSEFMIQMRQPFYRGSTLVTHSTKATIPVMLMNTLLYVGGGALIYAIMPCFTAYLCAKYNYKLSAIIFVVYTFMLCAPIVGAYPTELTFLRDSGLYDSIFGNYVQKMTGSGMYFFVYFAYFKGMSNTYREAAELDGAGELTIMLRIYFPLAIKIILTVFLIQFVALWNDYQTPLLYLPTHPTLAYGVFYINTSLNQTWYYIPYRMAACVTLFVPILIIFIAFRNKLMGDVSLGGIKE